MAPVRLLIVDDHADMRALLRIVLRDAPEEVEVAGEADCVETALVQLERVDPDVVVMDLRMPRIDGFEAAAMLRARRPGLPVLLCTGLVDGDISARAAAAGIDAVVEKSDLDVIAATAVRLARRDGARADP